MELTLAVVTLGGEGLLSPSCFMGVDIEIMRHHLLVDLRALLMFNFDVIFDMDWLCEYHASLECFECRVMFHQEGRPKFSFRSSLALRN